MNRKTILAALACALLLSSMLGCGTSNHLQSITLQASMINGKPVTTQGGFYNLDGLGGTVQLQAIGNYSSGQTRDLTTVVTFTMIPDPIADVDDHYIQLSNPPLTASISSTGLVTATEPAVCTWIDVAQPPATTPSFAYVGDYMVTASFNGMKSQPVYLPVASASGIPDSINTAGLCGPQSTS